MLCNIVQVVQLGVPFPYRSLLVQPDGCAGAFRYPAIATAAAFLPAARPKVVEMLIMEPEHG